MMFQKNDRQQGLTLVEMMMALAVVSMMSVAMSSMMVAAGNAMETGDDFRRMVTDSRVMINHINTWVHQAKRLVNTSKDTRYTNFWMWSDDEYFPGQVNLAEIKIIQYDSQEKTLTLLAVELTDVQKASSASNLILTPTQVGANGFPGQFKIRTRVKAFPLAKGVNSFKVTLADAQAGIGQFVELIMTLDVASSAIDQTVLIACSPRAVDTAVEFSAAE